MFVIREAQLRNMKSRTGQRLDFFSLSAEPHSMESCVLGTTAQDDAKLASWRIARVAETIKLVYRVLGSWDPDVAFPEGDEKRVLGRERVLAAAVPKSSRVCARIGRLTDEDQEQVMLACSTTPPAERAELSAEDAELGDTLMEEQEDQIDRETNIMESELTRLRDEVNRLGVMSGMQGLPPLIGDLNSLEMVKEVHDFIRNLHEKLVREGKACPDFDFTLTTSDGSPSYAAMCLDIIGFHKKHIHSSGVFHYGKEFALKFSEVAECVLRLAISEFRSTPGTQDFFFFGGDPDQGQSERLVVLWASDADAARRCHRHLVTERIIRESDTVKPEQVLAYKSLRMTECPAAFMWGIADLGWSSSNCSCKRSVRLTQSWPLW